MRGRAYSAGMQIAIMGMDASAWEIRNSASLLYAALIMRMLGFRNMQQVSDAPSSIVFAMNGADLPEIPLITKNVTLC